VKKLLRRRDRRTEGAIAVEYVVILFAVAVLSMLAWQQFGDSVRSDVDTRHTDFGYFGGR